MKQESLLLISALSALAVVACNSDSATSTSTKSGEGKAPSVKTEAAKSKVLKLEAIKVQLDANAPEGFSPMGENFWIAILADGAGTNLSLQVKDSASFEEYVGTAEMFVASKGSITRNAKTADGGIVEYNNTGSMGANFFIDVVKVIDGKKIQCGGVQSSQAQADAVSKACLTLRGI